MINAIRAHLAEFGIVAPVGRKGVEHLLRLVADAKDKRMPNIKSDTLGPDRYIEVSALWRALAHRGRRNPLARCEQIVQQTDPVFVSPRDVTLNLWLAEREIINAYIAMKSAW